MRSRPSGLGLVGLSGFPRVPERSERPGLLLQLGEQLVACKSVLRFVHLYVHGGRLGQDSVCNLHSIVEDLADRLPNLLGSVVDRSLGLSVGGD
jgi:hypothetical protein